MRQTLKRLAKMSLGYGTVQWGGPLISFIFTPIITHIISPSDYGIADYVLTISSAFGTLALFALPQALTTHFNDLPNADWQREATGSALATCLVTGGSVSLLMFLLAPQIAQGAFDRQDYAFLFRIAGTSLIFGMCLNTLTAAAQAALRIRWGMLLSAATILSTVAGNIIFIVILRLGVTGMVLTPVAAGAIGSLAALITTRSIVGRPSPAVIRLLLQSGALLLPTMLAAWALNVADRFFLVHYVSTEALGHYAIANKIASLLSVLMMPIYSAWTPLALAMQRDPTAKQRYADISRYFLGMALSAALALGLFATEILIVFTRTPYLPAAPYVGFLAYVPVISAVSTVLTTGAMASKQLGSLSGSVVTGAFINLILNFILIPPHGVWGATIATVIGYAVPQVILYIILQKRYPVPYPTGRLLGAILVQFVLLVIGLQIPPLPIAMRFGLKLITWAVLPLAFLILGVVRPYEVQQARLAILNRLSRVV